MRQLGEHRLLDAPRCVSSSAGGPPVHAVMSGVVSGCCVHHTVIGRVGACTNRSCGSVRSQNRSRTTTATCMTCPITSSFVALSIVGIAGAKVSAPDLEDRQRHRDDHRARAMLLAARVDHAHVALAPDDAPRRRVAADQSRHLALEVDDERGVAVDDPSRIGGALGRIPLLGERPLADPRRIRAVEPLHEPERELAFGP